MWYVIQVRTGSEESIRTQCIRNISDAVMEECFIPYYEEKRRVQGKWSVQKKILFPGYVFLDTEMIEDLYGQLAKVIGMTRLLGMDEDLIVPLTEKEVAFLKGFGGKEHVVEMSEGIIENSRVIVTSGPLEGKEGMIRKIDRHKRKAYLEIPMFGRMQTVQVGLEIISKSL